MTNQNDDDEESYLVPNNVSDNAIWCKIGDTGELEFVDWNAIQKIAGEYDCSLPESRNDKMLIAKLMWLTRKETLKECGK